LRAPRSDNGSLVSSPDAPSDSAATQIVLAFDDNRLASMLFGQYGQNLALIERRLGVVAEQRGNHVNVAGSRDGVERARRVLEGLYEQLKRGDELVSGDVEGAIRLAIAQGSLFDYDAATARPTFEEINLRKRPVRARTAAQDAYIRALRRHALVFGTGPAGTGKTWLAVAQAVQLFERKEVDRIILSRPAVEAGERLGFLPGDMREKVDPYLRPIYDALYDLMDARIVERALQTGEIEIAPLAFMRGRTLSNAVVILDDRHRRSEPSRSTARADFRPCGSDTASAECRGDRSRRLQRRGRYPSRARGAHRRRLRQGGAQGEARERDQGMSSLACFASCASGGGR
jgi:phosphate starvation-inducible protein PhoH and related proteins